MARTSSAVEVTVGRHKLRLTNQQKVLWLDDGLTKGHLIHYYRQVAPFILPHLRDRALTLKLYPDGIAIAPVFLQAVPKGTPDWIKRWPHTLTSRGKSEKVNWRIIASNEATLVWLANRAAIELHTWLSRTKSPERPDALMFDLDPGSNVTFADVCRAALDMRAVLQQAKLEVWPKTSGGKGIHLVVPLGSGHTFEGVRTWAERLAVSFQQRWPDRFTHLAAKTEREGRILIDYAQNSLGRTTACAYSVRGLPGGAVSAPLSWDEVGAGVEGEITPAMFTMRTMPERLDTVGDLFAPTLRSRQRLRADFDPRSVLPT